MEMAIERWNQALVNSLRKFGFGAHVAEKLAVSAIHASLDAAETGIGLLEKSPNGLPKRVLSMLYRPNSERVGDTL
jgi:hypothetical protein